MLVTWPGTEPGTAEGPGATLSRSFSAFRRSTSSWGEPVTAQGEELHASSIPGLQHSCGGAVTVATRVLRARWASGSGSHLHVVHGLPQLLQLVGRVEGFQADVRQLHLLLPQL